LSAFVALLDTLGVTTAELLARDDLGDILKYHVLSGSSVMSADLAATQDVTTLEGSNLTVTKNGSTVKAGSAGVSTADISCSNGVIHVIDAVLLPPVPDIVETAISAGNFTVLVEALQTAGLVDALKGAGPFTVFAPTDAAFTALLGSLGGLPCTAVMLLACAIIHDKTLKEQAAGGAGGGGGAQEQDRLLQVGRWLAESCAADGTERCSTAII